MIKELKWQQAVFIANVRGLKNSMWQKLAFMLPKKLVYFAAIRLMAHATTGKYSNTIVPELGGLDAIGRWSKDHWGRS